MKMAGTMNLILLTGLICVGFYGVLSRGMMVGDRRPADPDNADVQDAASWALKMLNQKSNNMYIMNIVKVKSVTTQVVAGIMYRMEVVIGTTDCLKRDNDQYMYSHNQVLKLEGCPGVREYQFCNLTLWSKSWIHWYKLEKQVCDTFSPVNIVKRVRKSVNDNADAVMNKDTLRFHKSDSLLGGDDHDTKHYQLMKDYTLFKDFKARYNKQYKTEDENLNRFQIFQDNMKKVEYFQKHDMGTARYGATQFADLTEDEFRKNYLTPKWNQRFDPRLKQAKIPTEQPPKAFDWRDHDAVSPVKNQGSCGSCWAFSTTGNVEGQWAIKKKKLVSLSEQELVDCDKLDQGCGGGLPSNAYQAIRSLGGLETEKEYPYKAEDEKCVFVKSEAKVYINGSLNISSDETKMAAWLAQNGPISIGINAFAMQFYFGGIAHPWKIFCDPESLDHGVLIVGYGVKGSTPYWIIKNSWGSWWGEDGYYLVYRGGGVCGLNRMCTSAEVL